MSVAAKLFSQFVLWFGFYGTFWFYSGVTIGCIVFGYCAMPETARISPVNIQETDVKKCHLEDYN